MPSPDQLYFQKSGFAQQIQEEEENGHDEPEYDDVADQFNRLQSHLSSKESDILDHNYGQLIDHSKDEKEEDL